MSPPKSESISIQDTEAASPTSRVFVQGWRIVGLTFIVQFFSMGIGYYSFGVFLKPLSDALSTDRFLVSLALSMQMVVIALMSPIVGRWVAWGSIRTIFSTGILLMVSGLLISAHASALWHVYLGFGFVFATGSALTSTVSNTALIANWFVRRRGTALGVSGFGITISGAVLVPIVSMLVIEYGWRSSMLILAVVTPIILLPLVYRLAIKTPEEVGLLPDGDLFSTSSTSASSDDTNWTWVELLRQRDVWLIVWTIGTSFMSIASVVVALHSHATDLGMTAARASIVVATTTLMASLSKPAFGIVADHFNLRAVVTASLLSQILGIALLFSAADYVGLLVGGFFFGLGYGGTAPLWAILVAGIFGRRAFSWVMGITMLMMLPFNLIALPFATYIFKETGSYSPAFGVLLVAMSIAMASSFLIRLPPKQGSTHSRAT